MIVNKNRQQRREQKASQKIDEMELLRMATRAYQQNKLPEASSCLRRFLAASPGHADALHMLGIIALQQNDFSQASKWITKAIASHKDNPAYHSNLAVALEGLGRLEEAEAAFRHALDRHPDFPEAWNNLGNVLMSLGRRIEAEECYRRALALRPQWADAHSHLSGVLQCTNRGEEALHHARRAVELNPDDPAFLNSLGNSLREVGRWEDALDVYDKALERHPGDSSLLYNRSLALMIFGRLEEGWRDYEHRFKSLNGSVTTRRITRPVWDGRPLNGKRLLVHSEQGLGDTIHFCRFLPQLEAFGGKILFDVQPALERLLAGIPGVDSLSVDGGPLPSFDVHCPLLSLPRLLGVSMDSIPAAAGYLRSDPALQAEWRQRLGHEGIPKIGLAWRGNPQQVRDMARSVDAAILGQWLRQCELPPVQWVCLQKDARPDEIETLGVPLFVPGPDLHDLADTAAVIDCLDLVVTIDTSICHLAGALGRPVWTMLDYASDWRYLRHRQDSPWYDSMRLFRQPVPGDWSAVLMEVGATLRKTLKA